MARQDHLNHKPTEAGVKAIEAIRRDIIKLEETIEQNVPNSREKALAMTKLEEVRMWAVKGAVISNSAGVDELPPEEQKEAA